MEQEQHQDDYDRLNSKGLAINGFGMIGTAFVLTILNLFLSSWILFAIVWVIAGLGIAMLFMSTSKHEKENEEKRRLEDERRKSEGDTSGI